MKKSNVALTTFLDEKFAPLQPKIKLVIVVCLIIIPTIIFYFVLYSPNTKQTQSLKTQEDALRQKIISVKKRAADLPKFESELDDARDAFLEKAALLPNDKEIPQLLKDISSLGRSAGLDFLKFKPNADIPRDFYAEIPVSINVRGPYHSMGYFFDQVSKLERIVTVSNVKMGSPKKEAGEMLLNSDCKLLTYRFTDKELPKPTKK